MEIYLFIFKNCVAMHKYFKILDAVNTSALYDWMQVQTTD